jgi:hypothetical protein
MDQTKDMSNLRNWVPINFSFDGAAPFVEWCYLGEQRFTDPFFEDTIGQRMRLPFNLVFRQRTSIDVLTEIASGPDVIPPTGFIFHMSRCGSTLVAQMLAALEKNIVISEPPPIDSVIGAMNGYASRDSVRLWLQGMVAALGRRRSPSEKNYFIKFDSWNTLDLDIIGEAFPTVPFIFLYRNPIEVIVSQTRQPGMHMIPGALEKRLPELSLNVALRMSSEEYCARIVGKICESALKFAEAGRILLVNYDELPVAVFDQIAKHFGVAFDPDETGAMHDKTHFNAKTPQLFFESDVEAKRLEASVAAHEAAETFVDPIYRKLEAIRLGSCTPPVLKLPLTFDSLTLQRDLQNLGPDDWTPHFNTQYYEGDWSGVALRSAAGSHVGLYPDPAAESYADTPLLEKCPSVRDVLRKFECETESVRYLRLGPGDKILRHRDHMLSVEDGLARVHIPVKTSPHVDFYLDGNRIEMHAGEAWYLNFNLFHSVENHGRDERIHLVIDCVVNDWFRSFFKDAG